jgi:hypothetical protein
MDEAMRVCVRDPGARLDDVGSRLGHRNRSSLLEDHRQIFADEVIHQEEGGSRVWQQSEVANVDDMLAPDPRRNAGFAKESVATSGDVECALRSTLIA